MLEKKNYLKLKGMTLVEMLIALVIFSLGIGGFTMLASKGWKMNSFVIEAGNATNKANRALNATAKSLRKIRQADNGSYAIDSVSDDSLTVYLDDDGDGVTTERVHFYLDSSTQTFKKGVTKPIAGSPVTYPVSDETTVVIADYVVNTSSDPIFEYYNNKYPIDLANNPLINPATSEIKLVRINLWVNIKPLTAPDNVNLESFVEFRNLNEN
ncbi:MAG: prepilin-type N-terminal cleavage/methylation domain-containing protein [Candidatus Moranbacteria bacterium]|nr:prepilin-type N-terminal cleavage/methylation domain-containing protein [Candidatus Moranbacteria bacterium]